MSDLFDQPLTDDELLELAAMPSHELYLLTKMVPYGTVRAKQVSEVYTACVRHEIGASS